jgi:tetratricopeptide (TPR) repeat protein
VPDEKDINAIEKILQELGETELELGEVDEREYLAQQKLGKGPPAIAGAEETEPVPSGGEEDFQELLKDIEIGLTEERELEEKMTAEGAVSTAEEAEPAEEISLTEAILPEEEALLPEIEMPDVREEIALPEVEIPAAREEAPSVEEEPPAIELMPGLEELLVEGAPAAAPEESAAQIPEPAVPEEPSPEMPELEPPLEVEVPLPEEEVEPETPEAVDEGTLDLPVDFDIEDLTVTEKPHVIEGFAEEEVREEGFEGMSPGPEAGEILETGEPEALSAAPERESISIEEPPVELEDLIFKEPEEVEGEPATAEVVEESAGETPPTEEVPETSEDISFEDLEVMSLTEEALPGELPPIEDIGVEEPQAEEPAHEVVEEIEGQIGPEMFEDQEIVEEEAAVTGGEAVELTEDDIGQIKTKLSTMSPVVATEVQDIIVKGTLPTDSMNRIVELLILDAPEQEIVEYVERVTGRKIAVPRIRRPVPVVARKPGVLGALAENLGPFVRASMLVGAILIVLAALFFVFFWNPYNASKHYKTALENIRERDWEQVESNIDNAAEFQNKSPHIFHGIRQYDNLGWTLMLAGNYSLAIDVFERGIRRELDKNQSIRSIKGIGNSRIFMRLAALFNVLGEYAQSEELHAFMLNDLVGLKSAAYEAPEINKIYQKPYIIQLLDGTDFIKKQKENLRDYKRVESEDDRIRKTDEVTFLIAERIAEHTSLSKDDEYDFRMLRGENLIDELTSGSDDFNSEEERRDDIARIQFQEAARKNRGEAAPLYKQLQIAILKDDYAQVVNLTDQILRRFPKSRDEEVQTGLARYYIEDENFSIVRDLLLMALSKKSIVYPYPPAYAAYGAYYNVVGNNTLREEYLRAAIVAENKRVLPRTWNYRDRKFVAWTDYTNPNSELRKSERVQASEQQVGNSALLFPWDRTDFALLSSAYNGLGEIYALGESFENVAQSIQHFRKAIDPYLTQPREEYTFNPEVPEATFNLAQLYFYRVKDYDNAFKLYRAYQKAFEENKLKKWDGSAYSPYVNDLYYNLGYLYYHQPKNNQPQNWTKALEYWSKLEPILPDNPHLQMAIGNTLLHKGAYESALGRYLYLAEVYERLVDGLGEIKPWQDYDRRILGEAAAVYNNLGVTYQKLSEQKPIDNYQQNSLIALYTAGEYADILGEDRGNIQYNIYYIVHPEVVRSDMKINDDLSDNYRFTVQ